MWHERNQIWFTLRSFVLECFRFSDKECKDRYHQLYWFFSLFSRRMPQSYQPIIVALLLLFKSKTQPQRYQSTVNPLFWLLKLQQWLRQRVRTSTDSYRTADEEEATTHDLLAQWSLGARTSVQKEAIFDEWRWGGTGRETGNHGQKCECELNWIMCKRLNL